MVDYHYTPPFDYSNGLRDIVNSICQTVDEREQDAVPSVVWSSDSTVVVPSGGTVSLVASPSDPVMDVQVPVVPGDITASGPGAVTATIDHTSGQSVTITLAATGGDAVVTHVQLRGVTVPVARRNIVCASDPYSIGIHGTKVFQGTIPWATSEDVQAVESVILAQYSERSPIIQLHVQVKDDAHLHQILERSISDRITIVNGELVMNAEFYIENISHTVLRNDPDKLPVHEAVFGCDRIIRSPITNPFTFDKVGAGFDDGQFGGLVADDPATIFIFDHPTNGKFDTGVFGT